jgi:anti-sigma28 factor (negative regulator of flagellin synthesis)
MQISSQQVQRVLEKTAAQAHSEPIEPVHSVEELAVKYGVPTDDVERFTSRAAEASDDPFREQRITELARKVMDGAYTVAPEQVVDMAERRAIADRSRLL